MSFVAILSHCDVLWRQLLDSNWAILAGFWCVTHDTIQLCIYTKITLDKLCWLKVLASLVSSLFALNQGLAFGISGVMLPQLREDKTILYDPSHESWIASISCLSMVLGCLTCGTIADSYGRKAAHIILGVPFIMGWIITACANSTSIIIIARFIIGISAGGCRVLMVYIGELADPKYRTSLLALPNLMLCLGLLFCHLIGYYLPWKTTSLICLIPSLISLITSSLFLKESPLWLISKGKTDEGINIFRWFRGTNEASEAELKAVLGRQSEKVKMSVKEMRKEICSKAFIKPMLVLMVVMTSTQFSGVQIINIYVIDIFEKVLSGNVDPFIMMIIFDIIKIVATVVICFFGMCVSKKVVFLVSTFGGSIAAIALVTCLMIDCAGFLWVPVLCLVIFIIFISILPTVCWSFVPELLPNRVRGFGSGLNAAFTFFSLFVILKITPAFVSSYGVAALFAFFGVSMLVCGSILCFILPETNGMSLQSIEDKYNKNVVAQSTL